jgi:hypothetical protein
VAHGDAGHVSNGNKPNGLGLRTLDEKSKPIRFIYIHARTGAPPIVLY